MKIQDSVALVTGARRGIGRAFVEALLSRGARRVYSVGRQPLGAEGPAAAAGERLVPLVADITREADVRALADAARDVTLLVNNAGVASFGTPLEQSLEDVRRDMETNYFGTLGVIRAFVPLLEANAPGAIVNVLSVVSLAPMPALGGYSASKAAAYSLTRAIRPLLAGKRISVHDVLPGPVDTDMARDFTAMPKAAPADVANAVLDALASGEEYIAPDPIARDVRTLWMSDPKAVEARFGAM